MTSLDITPPITIGDRIFVRYIEGHTYEDTAGATLYSGVSEPSAEDAADCIQNPRTPPLAPVDPASAWAAFLAGSIPDVPTGIALKANRAAKADFTGMFTLLSAGIQAGALSASAPVKIWDASEVEHTLPASEVLVLLLRYGFAWQAAFNELAP